MGLLQEVVADLSKTLEHVRALVARGAVRVALHGYEELAGDAIRVRDAVDGLGSADSCGLGHPGGAEFTRCLDNWVQTQPREMGRDVAKEADMSRRSTKRLVREGEFVAEVDFELVEAEGGWTPYLSLEDAYKLDDVRDALRAGDIERALQLAERIYRLTPVRG